MPPNVSFWSSLDVSLHMFSPYNVLEFFGFSSNYLSSESRHNHLSAMSHAISHLPQAVMSTDMTSPCFSKYKCNC